ncbi:MAG: helix-turn-helix domain-containing protein [Oscillospiraceae bacterium]|nr:helix-turn-helix domain-containing protein [Oscillospiraceae bacterium]
MAKGKYEYWLTADGLMLLESWARNGLTQEQIAKNMDISRSTLKEWIKRYPAISAALRTRARDLSDIEVENALRKKALGYNATVRKAIKLRHVDYDARGRKVREYETIEIVEEEVHVAADTQAGVFWLKNRRPADWREKRDAPPTLEELPDDGFIKMLSDAAGEVFEDGVDEPANTGD